jgi:hypothetical protein
MPKKPIKAAETPIRYRKLRDDAKIAAAEKTIASDYGLPIGCIRLVLPNGRKARSDKTISGLRIDWGE